MFYLKIASGVVGGILVVAGGIYVYKKTKGQCNCSFSQSLGKVKDKIKEAFSEGYSQGVGPKEAF